MQRFSFIAPKSLEDALLTLHTYGDACLPVAGGTDLIVEMHAENKSPAMVMDIGKLPELRGIWMGADDMLHIGAGVTFDMAEKSDLIYLHAPALHQAAQSMGSRQIRNLATLGGNLANGSVAADSPAPLVALDAKLTLASSGRRRMLPIADFFTDKGTLLEPAELITDIAIPVRGSAASAYAKLGRRKALAIVVLGVGLMLEKGADGRCANARVVLGAVAPHPMRLEQVEEMLIGEPIIRGFYEACLPRFSQCVRDLIPARASMPYKSAAVAGVARQAFEAVLDRLEQGEE